MKEHELLHRAMNAYGLDREAIRQAARCRGRPACTKEELL